MLSAASARTPAHLVATRSSAEYRGVLAAARLNSIAASSSFSAAWHILISASVTTEFSVIHFSFDRFILIKNLIWLISSFSMRTTRAHPRPRSPVPGAVRSARTYLTHGANKSADRHPRPRNARADVPAAA